MVENDITSFRAVCFRVKKTYQRLRGKEETAKITPVYLSVLFEGNCCHSVSSLPKQRKVNHIPGHQISGTFSNRGEMAKSTRSKLAVKTRPDFFVNTTSNRA